MIVDYIICNISISIFIVKYKIKDKLLKHKSLSKNFIKDRGKKSGMENSVI